MGLPTIETPTFKLEIPSSKKEMKFRPFLVKEEKILTLASEAGDASEMVEACQQVVSNCSFGELDVEEIPMFDLQWIFLQLRSKSVSELQEFNLICGHCSANLPWQVNLNDFKLVGLEEEANRKIEIDDKNGIVLKYPSAKTMGKAESLQDDELILECVECIYSEDEVWEAKDIDYKELIEYIDNMPVNTLSKVKEFFENVPLLGHTIDFKCPKCEGQNSVNINGYEHFFA
jgi:hypothetical protein